MARCLSAVSAVESVQQLVHTVDFPTDTCDVIGGVRNRLGNGFLFFLDGVGDGFETRRQRLEFGYDGVDLGLGHQDARCNAWDLAG